MKKRTFNGLYIIALIAVFFAVPALATETHFEYPGPDPDRDVKDISFYHAPDEDGLLRNVDGSRPRNVILLIGDGMGVNHVTLTRLMSVGPDGRLHMERMPFAGLMRTHSANRLVTDSGAASTALATGIKTDNGRIGTAPDGTPYISILQKARDHGYRTAVVVNCTLSHATPAGFAAHVEHRRMEPEIARQMLANRVDILFGGGRNHFLPEPHGTRQDGLNLIDEAHDAGYQVIYNREQLRELESGPVLGLFANGAMTTYAPEPMLDEKTRAAIDVLSSNAEDWFSPEPKFFMMVEGAQIDWAGHANDTDNTVRQTLLFDMAVKEAINFAKDDQQTLVIVTADHETGGLLIQGGLDNPQANWNSGGHTAGDVPIYAFGPGAQRFSGTHDITDIPKIIADLLGFDNFPAPLETAAGDTAAQPAGAAASGY